MGFCMVFKLCDALEGNDWKVEWVPKASVPYMYNNRSEWVSFENEESLRKKVKWFENGK
jgi:GH18 family chitinase